MLLNPSAEWSTICYQRGASDMRTNLENSRWNFEAVPYALSLDPAQYRSTQQAVAVAVYNAELIQTQLRTILHERALWEGYFARTGIIPLRIIYERFLQDPAMHVAKVAALMKVDDVAIDERKIDLTMQRNSTSDEWRRRFREDCGDPNVLHG